MNINQILDLTFPTIPDNSLATPIPFISYLKITFPYYGKETSIKIYDIHGQLLFATKLAATIQEFNWDGRNASGQIVNKGIYIVKSYSIGEEHSRIIIKGL